MFKGNRSCDQNACRRIAPPPFDESNVWLDLPCKAATPCMVFAYPFAIHVIVGCVNNTTSSRKLDRLSSSLEWCSPRMGLDHQRREYDTRYVQSTTAISHISKLAPTIRSVIALVEVSFASSMQFVFHDTRCASVTRRDSRSACSSDRASFLPRRSLLASSFFVETTSDVSVASTPSMPPFGCIVVCSSRGHCRPPLVKEEELSCPETPFIHRSES